MTKPNKKKPSSTNVKRTNGWDMCQNVLIYGMRSGQLIGAIIGLILIISFLKMSNDQIYEIFIGTGALFSKLYILGWVAFAGLLLYTRRTLKKLRMTHKAELNRIADVKSELQIELSKDAFKSSQS